MWWHNAAITCMSPPMNWVPVILVCPVLACSGFVVWFCVLFGFVLCVFAVCLVYDDDGPMDYVQVLPQFSFAVLNSTWPGTLICITAHAMSYSVVNDLAKAMKALDGKKCFYWASKLPRGTFWAGLKTFKSLAAAFEGLSTAQPSAAALEASCWLCHGASMCLSIGPTSCFYWASKLPRGTFWAGLETFKSLAAAFEGLSTAQPSAAAPEASCWLCHGASMCLSIGPTSCFYWASKLPRGTFWAGLKTFKSLAAAFVGLSTAQPSAAALEASRLLCHGASLLAPKAISIGLRNCRVAEWRLWFAYVKCKPHRQQPGSLLMGRHVLCSHTLHIPWVC